VAIEEDVACEEVESDNDEGDAVDKLDYSEEERVADDDGFGMDIQPLLRNIGPVLDMWKAMKWNPSMVMHCLNETRISIPYSPYIVYHSFSQIFFFKITFWYYEIGKKQETKSKNNSWNPLIPNLFQTKLFHSHIMHIIIRTDYFYTALKVLYKLNQKCYGKYQKGHGKYHILILLYSRILTNTKHFLTKVTSHNINHQL